MYIVVLIETGELLGLSLLNQIYHKSLYIEEKIIRDSHI
ncbi:unnamed protein product [Nezara viridula]|uniref:Uncharacterized protein n=1 Tax=Nezara viridula TaxID=85310 RepID=A0A9P0GYH8_NEZVI|nr:unnamed protein product [Nezara viridula]